MMNYSTAYNISMGVTTVLVVAAYVLLLRWAGFLIAGSGSVIPWLPLLLLALTALNCIIRARLIKWRRRV